MVHGLTVRVVLRDAAAFPIFLRAFEDLYAYSRTCEPDTLTYELHKATDSDDADADRTWLILERYTSKADLTEVHNKSAFLQKFGAWVGENIGVTPNAQGERPVLESIKLEHWTEVTIESSTAPSTEKPPKSPKVVPAKASDGNTTAVSPNRGQEEQGNGVLVFAGARAGDSPAYMRDAEILGRIVGRSGRPLVYGAGTVGVMGAVAQAAREVGGEVISVIPYALAPREVAGDVQTDAIVVDTMSERKAVMFAKSNWTIALPGGIGTLDELFEVLTLSQLNAYKSKVGILNTDNFYGPLLAMLEHLVQAKFLDKHTVEQLVVRSDPQQLWEALGSAPDPVPAANLVWPRAF